MDDIFTLIMLILGVYVINAAIKLYRNKTITPSLMRTPKGSTKRMRDLDGFVEYMKKKVLALGIILIAVGFWYVLTPLVQQQFGSMAALIAELAVLVAFFIFLFYYLHCVKKAEAKYCG